VTPSDHTSHFSPTVPSGASYTSNFSSFLSSILDADEKANSHNLISF
jgi:hypothetical protein